MMARWFLRMGGSVLVALAFATLWDVSAVHGDIPGGFKCDSQYPNPCEHPADIDDCAMCCMGSSSCCLCCSQHYPSRWRHRYCVAYCKDRFGGDCTQ